MKAFEPQKDSFEFNEIEVVDGKPVEELQDSLEGADDIHKNLDDFSDRQRRPSKTKRSPSSDESELPVSTPLYNIPFESLSRRERKRLLGLERKVQKQKLQYEFKAEKARLKAKMKSERNKSREGKLPRYGWAFFLCSMLIGLGISIPSDGPTALFVGMGIGFLFLVDPIYDKVIQAIKDI